MSFARRLSNAASALLRATLSLGLAAARPRRSAQAWPTRPRPPSDPYAAGSSPTCSRASSPTSCGASRPGGHRSTTKPGGGGNNGTASSRSAGDGYTFARQHQRAAVYNTVLYKNLPYDPFTELRPVVLGGAQANVCAVRSDAGIQQR